MSAERDMEARIYAQSVLDEIERGSKWVSEGLEALCHAFFSLTADLEATGNILASANEDVRRFKEYAERLKAALEEIAERWPNRDDAEIARAAITPRDD